MTEEKTPVLETKSLGIQFGGLKAVNDVNMQIYPGELVGLIGPNGAGKTTIFNLITGNYQVEERMMLHGTCKKDGRSIDEARALNDIVITRKGSLQIINFNIYVNGKFLHRYHADGMIIATPTGSTGYNLSAGGPVATPGAKLILVSPICPHSMQNRSIVLAPEDTVTIEVEESREGQIQEVEAIFDGSHKQSLRTGDKLEIRKSCKTTGIIKLSQMSFLEILHRKMSD